MRGMKSATLLALFSGAAALAACGGDDDGGNGGPKDAPGATADAPTDAPMLPVCASPRPGTNVTSELVGQVTGTAVLVTAPRGDRRQFVLEQQGRIRLVKDGAVLPTPFLDLSDIIGATNGSELGLLGLAFHPEYAAKGTFYVFYTRRTPDDPTQHFFRDIVARCQVSAANPDLAQEECTEILEIKDRFNNHNGGMMEFGADGYLWIGTGDGGDGGDPDGNAQTLMDGMPRPTSVALLGKILRLDVDNPSGGKQYGIPSDNPYAGGGGPPEVYMRGVRNPWRWAFDRVTNDMWIADVGQENFEEVNVLRPAEQKGANLGWKMYEGNACYAGPCDPAGKTFPKITKASRDQDQQGPRWESITGGDVYRGTCYPDLQGWYFFTDYDANDMRRAKLNADGSVAEEAVAGSFPSGITSIHADASGELFLTTGNGLVHKLVVE